MSAYDEYGEVVYNTERQCSQYKHKYLNHLQYVTL